jgi:hypothetical protein
VSRATSSNFLKRMHPFESPAVCYTSRYGLCRASCRSSDTGCLLISLRQVLISCCARH